MRRVHSLIAIIALAFVRVAVVSCDVGTAADRRIEVPEAESQRRGECEAKVANLPGNQMANVMAKRR